MDLPEEGPPNHNGRHRPGLAVGLGAALAAGLVLAILILAWRAPAASDPGVVGPTSPVATPLAPLASATAISAAPATPLPQITDTLAPAAAMPTPPATSPATAAASATTTETALVPATATTIPTTSPQAGTWQPGPVPSDEELQAFVRDMPLADKVGQMMMVGFPGQALAGAPELRSLIADYHVGGLVLLERNAHDPRQVAGFLADAQKLAAGTGSGLPSLSRPITRAAISCALHRGSPAFRQYGPGCHPPSRVCLRGRRRGCGRIAGYGHQYGTWRPSWTSTTIPSTPYRRPVALRIARQSPSSWARRPSKALSSTASSP